MYVFDGLDELYETAEELPVVDRHDVYAHHEGSDEWEEVPYRDSLWTDDGRTTGVVSSSEDFYNIIQYGDVLETVGDAIDRHGIEPSGRVSVSPTAHKMSASVEFDGATVYASQDDPVDLGLQIQTGHSGFHGLKYDIGAERQVCSNGMTAFISELGFEQTHGEPFQPGLAYNAVDAVVESPAEIEQRLAQAQNRELFNQDEALLVLMESGIDRYLENPVPDLLTAMQDEVSDPNSPTLWETYNAATRALTHYTHDVPDYEVAEGLEKAAQLLEDGTNSIPDPERLGEQVVNNRSRQLIEHGDSEPYWPEEEQTLRELMQEHELTA
ncbi:DUF932 domain-containing protein [Halonotius terrestris]|uniref:DUF932 domain-containing protein n=1 Tax=Halonotius terrestris TaxID=2487750 RepID=UPI00163BFFE8|nr:DUF932 domain-containing protein [Halonotius terrestris]